MSRNAKNKPIAVTIGAVTVKIYKRNRATASGKTRVVFEVADKKPNGERRLQGFNDEARARREAERIARQTSTGHATAARMTNADAELFGRAAEYLRPTGIGLDVAAANYSTAYELLGGDLVIEAAKFYARHRGDKIDRRTVAEVVTELVAAKRTRGKSGRYLGDLSARLNRFARSYSVDISTVTTADVQRWMDRLNGAQQTAKNYRTVLHTLFQFAEARGYIIKGENPVVGTEKIDVIGGDIQIYTPDEIAALLKSAPAEFVPVLAIGAFAGLRTAEMERMDWKDIDLTGGFITVGTVQTKTRSRRLVPIQPNLASWLAKTTDRTGKVWKGSARAMRSARAATVQTAGIAWKDNAARHSYISYRLAAVQDVAKVSLEAGNSPGVIFKSYRELVKPDAAAAFFAIVPDAPANVVAMQTASV